MTWNRIAQGCFAAAFSCLVAVGVARAADLPYPQRPVRVIVPYPAGGGVDPVTRAVGQKFQERTGQSIVLDNRGGAGGLIGTEIVAKSAPDGYTMLMATNGQISMAPHLYAKVPYDPLNDLIPIVHLVDAPMVLLVNAAFPAQTLKDYIAEARAKPRAIGIALSGVGGVSHLAMELFRQRAGIELVAVPYRGAGAAMGDIASGSVPSIIASLAAGKPLLDSGRVRALAVTTKRRASSIPNVPTFIELGLPEVEVSLWIGLMGPKGIPPGIVRKLESELIQALGAPDVKERLAAGSNEIVGAGPGEFGRMIRADYDRWKTVVREANIKLD
jgi:tripartite-type tricarboxylate transporter receptor subunit TctC